MLAFAAGALVILASLLNLLLFHRYPLLTAEVALVVAAILAIAAIMVPIYTGQRRWGKAFLAGLLVLLAVDLNTDSLWAAVALGVAAAVASWRMGAGLLRFLALLAAVATVLSWLGLTERSPEVSVATTDGPTLTASASRSTSESAPPLIVHLILDEMGGLAGMREIESVRPRFESADPTGLVNAGFTVDSLAYTPWTSTLWSVPTALNFGRRPEVHGTVDGGGSSGSVEMLRALRDRGYALRLWQTSYLDFCGANAFDDCVTSDVNHLRILREVSLPASDRAILIGANLLAKSKIVSNVSNGVDGALASTGLHGSDGAFPPLLMQRRYVSTLHAERTLRHLARQLRNARRGEAYVAHILYPHYPFAHNADCSLRRFEHWEAPWGRRPIEQRWARYEQQYRCALRRVLEIVSAVNESAAAENSVIIVHGDHGPRIRDHSIDDDPSIERTILSTLFAVRRGGENGAVLDRQCPIGTLLAATVQPDRPVRRCARQYFRERGDRLADEPLSDWSQQTKSRN